MTICEENERLHTEEFDRSGINFRLYALRRRFHAAEILYLQALW